MKTITIKKSNRADTRYCDYTKVSKQVLREESQKHINDVHRGMQFFARMLNQAGVKHDFTKMDQMDQFHADFLTGFKTQTWYERHKATERHHIEVPEGVREDINLIDVLEYVADAVMAGMGREGKIRETTVPPEVLTKALLNTKRLLAAYVVVED